MRVSPLHLTIADMHKKKRRNLPHHLTAFQCVDSSTRDI